MPRQLDALLLHTRSLEALTSSLLPSPNGLASNEMSAEGAELERGRRKAGPGDSNVFPRSSLLSVGFSSLVGFAPPDVMVGLHLRLRFPPFSAVIMFGVSTLLLSDEELGTGEQELFSLDLAAGERTGNTSEKRLLQNDQWRGKGRTKCQDVFP